MTSNVIRCLRSSILEILPRRSAKSLPISLRTQSGRQSRAFSHGLHPKQPFSIVLEKTLATKPELPRY
jgi:hypothetical protein